MTNSPYTGATPEQLQNPHVQELLTIHNLFREQLAAMLDYLQSFLGGKALMNEPEKREHIHKLIRSVAQYSHMLHGHHTIETSFMFPSLKTAGLAYQIIDRLNEEHDEIARLIESFNVTLNNPSEIGLLNENLQRLADVLETHLAYEEKHVCPLLAHQ